MIFTNTLSLILALAPSMLFAAPTPTAPNLTPAIVKTLADGVCDMSKLVMPIAPTPLPSPGAGYTLKHIAVGRGTQNYTCPSSSPSETPVAVGAVATLFNATCGAVRAPDVFIGISKLSLDHPVPEIENSAANTLLSGHHEFTELGVPFFKLVTDKVNFGSVQAKLDKKSPAPADASKGTNKLGSVPWLKLNATEGAWEFKEVYRLRTAGGVAPENCAGIQGSFSVEYAAEYWFWG